jgi:hypothetical protein
VWNTKEEWDQKNREFCKIQFKFVNDEVLDDEADEFVRKLNSYPQTMKKWEIVNYIKANIDQFR